MAKPTPYLVPSNYPDRCTWDGECDTIVIPPNFPGIIRIGPGISANASHCSVQLDCGGEHRHKILPNYTKMNAQEQLAWCEELLIKICSKVYGVNWELNDKFGL